MLALYPQVFNPVVIALHALPQTSQAHCAASTLKDPVSQSIRAAAALKPVVTRGMKRMQSGACAMLDAQQEWI